MLKGLSILVAFLALFAYSLLKWIHLQPISIVLEPDTHYDFIIVGGGTAGCVLAARLTEDDRYKVLLIEAGGEASWMSRVPLIVAYLQMTEMNWGFKTAKQAHGARGFINNGMVPRGKGLGGSSSINNMIHMRGVPFDYDYWKSSFNLHGWDYDSVLKYFKKSEQAPTDGLSDSRGCDGPLKLSLEDDQLGLGKILLDASKETKNFTGGIYGSLGGEGFSRPESNTYKGMRFGAAQAYLRPVMSRSNLHVMIHSRVTKILFNGIRALGVTVESQNGKMFEPKVHREIIVSAGVISSPHLLSLSGIGPAKELKELGVEVVIDKPGVGRGLSDQLSIPIYFHLEESHSINASKLKSFKQALKYLFQQKGYFSKTAVELVGRISLDSLKQNKTRNQPELLLLMINIGSVDEELYTKISNYKTESFRAIFPGSDNETKEGFVLLAVCLHPKSRGSVRTISKDYQVPPVIDPQYLSNEQDVDCLAKGYKFAWMLQKTSNMKDVGGQMHLPTHEECKKFPKDLKSKEYLRCLVRMSAMSIHHPVGTCTMGEGEMSVVDSNLRVNGVIGLRVVDSSVMPTQISGTPHATVVMIAEKAADMIKSDHI